MLSDSADVDFEEALPLHVGFANAPDDIKGVICDRLSLRTWYVPMSSILPQDEKPRSLESRARAAIARLFHGPTPQKALESHASPAH